MRRATSSGRERWKREGVHVVYGLVGLKVHSKVALVVRREGDAIRRYVHLGTGNYNPATARLYTDLGLFTCDEEIGADATDLFNYLTGYSPRSTYRKLLVAPVNLRQRHRGADPAGDRASSRPARPGHLIFKMNALEDPQMIQLLYQASQAGVKIDLLVRGICCLRPGSPASARTSASPASWADSWSTAAFTTSGMAARKRSIWAART